MNTQNTPLSIANRWRLGFFGPGWGPESMIGFLPVLGLPGPWEKEEGVFGEPASDGKVYPSAKGAKKIKTGKSGSPFESALPKMK